MSRFFIFACLLFFAAKVSAQQDPDSARMAILRLPSDSSKAIHLNNLAEFLRDKDSHKALLFAEEARALAEKINFERGLGPILQNIGWIHYRKGNYALSLTYSREGLVLGQKLNDSVTIAHCMINIAAVNYEQRQYPEAIRNFRKGLELAQRIQEDAIISRGLNNIALSYLELRKLDSAQYYAQQSILHADKVSDQFRSGFAYRTLGDVEYQRKNYKRALTNYLEALARSEKLNNNFLKTSTLHRMAKTYLDTKQYDQALYYLEVNRQISEQFDYKAELERTYKLMADVYYATHHQEKAIDYLNRYIALHDSLYNQRSNEQIAIQQARYESDMQQAQIDLLTKDALLRQRELNEQRVWNYIFIVGLLVLFGIGSILYFGNRRVRKINLELKESNVKIREQASQLKELVATKDKLFSIIGHDMRGPIASLRGLLSLASDANLTQEEFLQISQKLKANLDFVGADLDNLLHWARTQLKGIEPNYQLNSAHRLVEEKFNLFAEAAQMKDISLINNVPEELEIIADTNHLRLIFRNLISNAVKFCQPGGRVVLSGKLERGKIYLSVSDTGLGMSEYEVQSLFSIGSHFSKPGTNKEKGLGLGLLLVKEFVEKNQGTISVQSEPGQGTTFTVMLQGHKVLQEVL